MATLTLTPTITDRDEPTTAAPKPRLVPDAEAKPAVTKTIGQTLWIGVPLTVLAVCVGTIVMCLIGGIPLGEAIGYGTYLGVWIGGGFGVILTGAYYNHIGGLEG